jgi:hypothetical protein
MPQCGASATSLKLAPEPVNVRAMVLRVLRALLRSIVFLAGMVAGFAMAMVSISFAGSAAADFMVVFFGLGLMLAAPLCWIAAVWGRKGDYWTLGYVGAWLVFFVVLYVLAFVEEGKPIKTSDSAVTVAFVLLGVLYLVVLPIGAFIVRRRTGSDQGESRA